MPYDVEDIKQAARVSNLARLFQLLTNIFGVKKNMKSLEKLEGKEVSIHFPTLGDRYATIKVSNSLLHPFIGVPDNPSAIVVFNDKPENLVPTIIDVIRSPGSIMGIMKILFKYVIPGKIKLKGNLLIALNVFKNLMIGQHEMYKAEKRSKKPGDN